MQLATILKTTRQRSLLTQELFAKELGVTVSTVNRWEHGKAKPNMSAMKHIKEFCESHELQYDLIESEWLKAQSER